MTALKQGRRYSPVQPALSVSQLSSVIIAQGHQVLGEEKYLQCYIAAVDLQLLTRLMEVNLILLRPSAQETAPAFLPEEWRTTNKPEGGRHSVLPAPYIHSGLEQHVL